MATETIFTDYINPAESRETVLRRMHELMNTNVDSGDIKKLYKNWAPNYDKDDLLMARRALEVGAQILSDHLQGVENPRILDLAAGTGLAGAQLHKLGYRNLDALDASPDMLEFATRKNIYKNSICTLFGPEETEGIETECYDGLICVGSFNHGHLEGNCFPEILRIIKKGGAAVITVRSEKTEVTLLDEPLHMIEREGLCTVTKIAIPEYMEGYNGTAIVLKKC